MIYCLKLGPMKASAYGGQALSHPKVASNNVMY